MSRPKRLICPSDSVRGRLAERREGKYGKVNPEDQDYGYYERALNSERLHPCPELRPAWWTEEGD